METYERLIETAVNPNTTLTQKHNAFGEIVHQFQDMAYSIAYRTIDDAHLAQDIVQEAFVTAYRQLHQLKQAKAFPGWFKQIIISQCHRLLRNKQLPTNPLESSTDLVSNEPDPADAIEDIEFKNNVLAAIQSLPEREREVTTLFYLSGYSQKEISKRLQIPVTTVKKRLQYARKHLKGAMVAMIEVVAPTPKPIPVPIPVRKRPLPPQDPHLGTRYK